MTLQDFLKLELMIFAIKYDFFGYGSRIETIIDGKYLVYIEGENYICTKKGLIKEFDKLDKDQKKNIVIEYLEEKLLKEE